VNTLYFLPNADNFSVDTQAIKGNLVENLTNPVSLPAVTLTAFVSRYAKTPPKQTLTATHYKQAAV
jgi:hypothetical protein